MFVVRYGRVALKAKEEGEMKTGRGEENKKERKKEMRPRKPGTKCKREARRGTVADKRRKCQERCRGEIGVSSEVYLAISMRALKKKRKEKKKGEDAHFPLPRSCLSRPSETMESCPGRQEKSM